jgi:hypothetical protein
MQKQNEEMMKRLINPFHGYDPTAPYRQWMERLITPDFGKTLRGAFGVDPDMLKLPGAEIAEQAAKSALGMGTPLAAAVINQAESLNVTKRLADLSMSGAIDFDPFVTGLTGVNNRILAAIQGATFPRIDVPTFFDTLPDLSPIIQRLSERVAEWEQEGEQVLTVAGYDYLVQVVELVAFSDLAAVEEDELEAAVAQRLIEQTCSEDFGSTLLGHLNASLTLSGRAPIVEAALDAHRNGNDMLALPALFAQLEGTIADTLIVRQLAVRQGDSLYEIDPATGAIRETPNKQGKLQKVKFPGLKATAQHVEWTQHPVVTALADHISDKLSEERNKILHGIVTDYADPARSARVLMSLSGYAQVLSTLEQGQP